jgi:hypothetical protein
MKPITPHAACAKAIRAELKKAFPKVKFNVRSESFSMGDAVRIGWTDGVTTDQVKEIVSKYQYGTFDGMTDSYDITNNRQDLPQVKFVQTSRDFSEHVVKTFAETYRAFYDLGNTELRENSQYIQNKVGYWTLAQFTRHKLWAVDLTNVSF